jgi:hypothetical protein
MRESRERSAWNSPANDREISLGSGSAAIPERLLLAHARGEVLFIAGAGISKPTGLPDFRGLVLKIHAQLDPVVHTVISVSLFKVDVSSSQPEPA